MYALHPENHRLNLVAQPHVHNFHSASETYIRQKVSSPFTKYIDPT
jgi:hypothetical protein